MQGILKDVQKAFVIGIGFTAVGLTSTLQDEAAELLSDLLKRI